MKVKVELSRDEHKQAIINYIHDKNKISPVVDIDTDGVDVCISNGHDDQIVYVNVEYEI